MKHLALAIVVFTLAACGGGGGGGGGGTPTDPNQSFSLAKLQSTTTGTVYSSSLTGSDSNGTSYAGSINVATRAQEMYSGVLAYPTDLILNLSGGGQSVTVTSTSYIDASARNLLATVVQTTGTVCTPVSPDNLPLTVKIGDIGILSDRTCSDNTVLSINWRIEDGRNGNIKLIQSGVQRDQFNNIEASTEITFTINGSGNIIGFKTTTTSNANNFTLTYTS